MIRVFNKALVLVSLMILFFVPVLGQNTLDLVGLGSGTPASAAFSLRKLSSSYTGPLVRILVGSSFYDVYPDATTGKFATTSNISAAIGTYDAAVSASTASTLSSIISGSNAFVAIWYDQRGTGSVNLIQDVAASRPKIVSSGSIITHNSMPAIELLNPTPGQAFNSAATNLYQSQDGTTFAPNLTISVVFSSSAILTTGRLINIGGKDKDGFVLFGGINNKLACLTNAIGTSWNHSTAFSEQIDLGTSSVPKITTTTIEPANPGIQAFVNGTATSKQFNGNFNSVQRFSLGATFGSSSVNYTYQNFIGKVSEVIFFPSILNSTNRQALECSQSIFSGISTSNACPPTITTAGTSSTCYSANVQTTSLSYSATSGSPTSYSIDWDNSANTAGLTDQGSTSFAFSSGGGTITGINVPAALASGTYSGTMTISNGSNSGTTAISLTVSASPTLGTYSSTTVIAGQNTSITPTAAPTNSTSIVAYSTTNFSGTLTVNPTTGVVSVTNAKQAGTYLVTVKAFSSAGCTSTTTFTLTVVSNANCTQGNFSGTTEISVGSAPTSVAIGDFNGDGKQDFAAANYSSASVSIRLGDGAGGFIGSTNVGVGTNPRAVAIGDFNGDGKQDIAAPNEGSATVSICLGDGTGGFSGSTNVGVGASPYSVAIGDFNSDGKQDFAAANYGSTTVSIRLGDGAGGFSGTTNVDFGSNPGTLAIGDFNGDGKQDIAAVNYNNNTPATVSIRLGDGAGGFSGSTNVSVVSQPWSLAIGDFNGDGNQDFAATNSGSTTVSIRLGNGTGGFSGTTEVSVGASPTPPVGIAIGDFNGDGNQDIAATNYNEGSVSIRLGNGAGGFIGSTNVIVGTNPGSIAVGDFNGDGKQDIAVANGGSTTVSIRLGAGGATFTAQPGATACANTDVTYTTESGQTNYVWTVPGTLGTDYTITSGGIGSTDNTVTLKWLTAGSKIVTINYTNSIGCTAATATSSTATTVNESPVFLTQPLSSAQSICSGASSLNVEVDPGSGTVASYKWYSNASALNSGGTLLVTNTTTSISNTYSPTSTAYYYVTATNSNGCVGTSTVSGLVTITAAPSISSQPSASLQSVCITGTPTNLSVTASAGSGTIATYKWYSNTINSTNGGTLVSTTVGSLTTNSYTPSTAAVGTKYYYCVVTNSNGCSVTSTVSGGITVVTASVGGTATAAASSVPSGSTTTVTVSGYTGSIQWQQSANGTTNWTNVTVGSGGNTATYTTPVLSANIYYRAAITNGSCTVAYSSTASISTYVSAIGDVLVVSGGGSGGSYIGGGGGGGAVKYFTSQSIGSSFAVTVGAGGAGVYSGGPWVTGLPGESSSFGSLVATSSSSANATATAGGGGGGGSGGGGNGWRTSTGAGGIAVSGMGNNGGVGVGISNTSSMAGGGGGGAGAQGGNGTGTTGTAYGGNGGVGLAYDISGASVFYGGGGGGGVFGNGSAAGLGGDGGGGAGSFGAGPSPYVAPSGTPNTGGGGGGMGDRGTSGAGGSGVVIVRYPGSVANATGGTISYYTGYVVHTFNSSGTFTWTGGSPSTSITSTGVATTVCTSGSAQTTTLGYTASTGSPTSYSIDWNAAANTAGFADQGSTSHAFVAGGGTITGIVVPASLAAGTYTGTLTITGSTTYTQSISLAVGSVSGTISGAGTVTSGTNSTILTLSGYSGTIQWQSSPNNSTYTNIGSAIATYTATNLTATTFYRAIVTNGACAAATSSTATITVASASTAFGITGSTTANTMSNNVATVVDNALVVTANGTVSGFTVTITSDYTDGDVLGYTGSLPSGVTAAAFNTTSRSIVFTGTASAADWQTLLRTVTLTSTSNCYPTNRKVSFLPSNKYYNYFNGHYYEYISTPVNWATAKAGAASRSFYGRKGYLVTITSEAENNYIWKLIGNNTWIGLSCSHTEINSALGYNKFGSTTYGQFYWVTGPEKGTLVSTGLTNPVAASGVYNRWLANEPNNYKGNRENSGHMYNSGSAASYWNDFPATNTIAYIVEYGGSQGDDTSATVSFTRDIIISGSPAGTISGADTVCNGTNSTTLTFSGGGTIQRWEYSTDNFVTAGTTVPSSTASTLTATNLSSSRYYRAVVNTAGCTDLASSSALITVATTTAGSITATSADVCAGGSAALTLNGNSGDIQKWQVSTSADFTTGVTDISNTTNTLSHTLSSNGTYYFRAAVLNSTCSGGTAVYTEGYPVTVTTGTPPVGGTVNSVTNCGSISGTLTLSGSTGTSYQWEVSTDGGVVYTNESSTITTQPYVGISTTTKYRVLVTNGSCGSVYSSVGTITIGGTSGAQWTGAALTTDWGNTGNWCGYIIGDNGLDVTISATATLAPILDRDRTIGNLNFNSSGLSVTLGNYTLTASSITGASSSNYVKTTGTGKLKIAIGTGITTSLPVGNTAYNPVSITNNNSTSDYFSARVLDEVYANSVSESLNTSGRVQRTWDITKTNANSGSGVDFVFNWNALETSSFTTASLYNFSGGTWVSQTGTSSSTSTSFTFRGYTGTMSSFAILSGFTWIGTGGNNLWTNPLNWSTGTLPLATTDIIISSGTPRLNVDYSVGGTLTISGTGTLTIDPGKTLSIASTGVVDFGGKSVTIKSDITGTAQLGRIQGSLIGANNVTVERYIPATGRRYRMLTPSVNTSGSIKANWMEGNMNTSGTNVNTVAGYGTQITGPGGNANGFDVTGTNSASLYLTTNGVTPGYTSIPNTNGTLSALTGYFLFLRGDRSMNMNMINTNVAPNPVPLPSSATTLRATGSIVQGSVSNFAILSSAAGGFSMIANPYPAAISWDSVYAASSNINNYYTYWDPNLGFRGGFTTVSTTASTPGSLASKVIQSGQAFFVTTTTNGSATISIKESHKVGSDANNVHGIFKANTTVDDITSTKVKGISPVWENYQPNLQPTVSSIPEFRISLYYTESGGYKRLTDGAVALFDNQYTSALDGNDAVDAPNWDENIAITRNGQNLAIESREQLTENDTLAISMSAMKSMNYELQFQGSNFGSTLLQPLLIDNYLKTLTPLSLRTSTTVPFTVTSDTATSSKNRFKVVFKTSVVLPFTVTKISATKKNETVQVDWEVKTDEDLKSFDVERSADGRNFVKLASVASLGKGITLANYNWVDNNPMMGANYYRIKLIPQIGKPKVSAVAVVVMDQSKPSMEVYPNPTEGNDFNIKLSNLTKGIYQVIITASSGQEVLIKTIEHPGGSAVQSMVFDNDISKGVYRVQVKGEGLSLLNCIIKN